MKDVMIDIETLATRNDAAIIQIGAVTFDPETGAIGADQLLVSVDSAFYEDSTQPFHVCEKTQAWWNKQGTEAKKSLAINKVATPYVALDRLVAWFEKQEDFVISKKRGESSRVWANPPQFDLSILRFAASKAYGNDNELPWKYWQETDMRTLVHLGGHVDLDSRGEGLIQHRADHDAVRQALVVSELLERLRT